MTNAEALQKSKDQRLETGEGYKWTFTDLISAPFGLLIGALNALGGDSSASYCSRYTLSSRELLFDAKPYFLEDNKLDGYDYYHKSIAYTDNIAYSCYNAFATEVDVAHFKTLIT